jgi:predicted  nucleic acid-binding Zn-ribbon protein
LSILRGNRRSLKQEVENYQTQAADTERAGRKVEVDWLRKIEDLRKEIVTVDKDIAKRHREIREISAEYDADIERFRMLLDVVELRRNLSAERASPPR